MKNRSKRKKISWEKARDIQERVTQLIDKLNLTHINSKNIICMRSYGSESRVRARIWSFPKVWQLALNLPAHYVIEVLAENFDNLKFNDQTRILIHELMHIPKTFSGALNAHRGRYHKINSQTVEQLFEQYNKIFK